MGLVLIQDGGNVFDVLFEIRSTTGDELLSYGEEANFYLKGSTITIMSSLHWDENDDTFVFFSANDELQCPSIPSSHQRRAHNLRSTIIQFLVCC